MVLGVYVFALAGVVLALAALFGLFGVRFIIRVFIHEDLAARKCGALWEGVLVREFPVHDVCLLIDAFNCV